jgi:hypothetical protein
LELTPKARRMVPRLEPLWKAIFDATAEVLSATGDDILGANSRIEAEQDRRDLYVRASERLGAEVS